MGSKLPSALGSPPPFSAMRAPLASQMPRMTKPMRSQEAPKMAWLSAEAGAGRAAGGPGAWRKSGIGPPVPAVRIGRGLALRTRSFR